MRSLASHILRTDKALHFTTAIVADAADWENVLIDTGVNKLAILGVAIVGKEAVDFDLYIYSQDDQATADPATDDFIAKVDLDLSTSGTQIGGAGLYRYDTQLPAPIMYEDEDRSGELHLGLVPRVAGKSANPTGELVIVFTYDPNIR